MSMTTPIVDFVRSYAKSGTARLHMPGHKGQSLLGFEPLDITEICGADELYAPEGIIAESEANATRLFGTAHSYYSTEGSSQCIRAMLFLALQGALQNGKRPVLQETLCILSPKSQGMRASGHCRRQSVSARESCLT